ncbi:SHOCT domain-containing protein [Citreimonas salinaria]|uniref:Putative membrane protein n=1 Tax=Citreimonas salinaria TaxID=321339 RepID=A0A1H3N0R9_9RHOB|nr:SHOCT domain-containing protein [Citreimonas salinaria]SDY82045.1 putative membrane protein [Citreimonas salinaria]
MRRFAATAIIFLTSAAVTAGGPVFADPIGDSYYHGHMNGWGMGLMGFGMMILFWGGLAALIVLAIRWIGDQRTAPGRRDAMDVLKERLARGEIEPEEFDLRRKHLES